MQFSLVNYDILSDIITQEVATEKSVSSLSSKSIKGSRAELSVVLPGLETVTQDLLCLPHFNIDMYIDGMNTLIDNLNETSFALSPSVPTYSDDKIKIFGILGNDIIQCLNVFEINNILGGKMFRLTDGFVPIGSITNFDLEISKPLSAQKDKSSLTEGNNFVPVTLHNRFSILEESEDQLLAPQRADSVALM